MKVLLGACAFLASVSVAAIVPSTAAEKLAPGAKAPATVLQSVIDGKLESYDLQAAAAKRPVVLYFFPQAFTAG